MTYFRLYSAMLILTLLCTGCHSSTTNMAEWTRTHGGLVIDARQERVSRVAAGLLMECDGKPVVVRVLASDTVSAYGWPGGSIFVTRGLVDAVNDDELAAAIAHELGHLLSDGHLRPVMGLKGCEHQGDLDAESQADWVGCQLLKNRRIPPDAMLKMLQKVKCGSDLPQSCQDALSHRMELLRSRLSSKPQF